MYRRQAILTMASCVGISTTVAGCLDATSVRDYIDEAAALLEENDGVLSQLVQDMDGSDASLQFDDTGVRTRVDEAFEKLDAAEELGPTEDEQDEIDALRQHGSAQLTLADFFTLHFAFVSKFEEARAHWEAERFEDALGIFLELTVEIDEVRSELDQVRAAFVDIGRELDGLMLMEDSLDGFDLLIEGFIPFTRGTIAFHEGTEHFDAGDYESSIEPYGLASTEFTQANDIFSAAAVSHQSEEFDFENFACTSELFAEAVGYLKASAQAVLDDEIEKSEEYRQQVAELFESGRCE